MVYEVVGIGNPLLDFIVEVDEEFLESHSMEKGRMHLVDESKSRDLLDELKDREVGVGAGGSTANVLAGLGNLGVDTLFMGSVGSDEEGETYKRLSEEAGVTTRLVLSGERTGHAITFITPDYERTFATYLGAALELREDDVDYEAVKECEFLHVEGFQFESEQQALASINAMEVAKEHGARVSVDLADSMFIENNADVLREVVSEFADLVFMNEREAEAFTGVSDPRESLEVISEECDFVAITLGAEGSLIIDGGDVYEIPSYDVEEVNTNGAGDMYDAGVLFGLLNGYGVEEAGRIGSYAAAQVVASRSARIDRELVSEVSHVLEG